jgi:Tol biopolymer transport system component
MKYSLCLVAVAVAVTVAACSSPARAPDPPKGGVELVAPGVLSTDANELNSAFTPDGATVYLTRATPDFAQNSIYVAHRDGDGWTTPVLAPFSTADGNDGDPFVAPDGSALYFMSKRGIDGAPPRKDWDLWVADRAGDGWAAPRHLGPAVNAGGEEFYPVVTADGTLYFASDRTDLGGLGETDLYRSRRVDGVYQPPEHLGAGVNTAGFEHDAWVSPDETLMVFIARDPPGGLGGADLFVSRRGADGTWGPRRLLPAPINSEGWDFCPWVTPDGAWLYFTSSRGGKGGDIYRVPMSEVLADR